MSSQAVISKQPAKGVSNGIIIFTFLIGIFMGALDHGIIGPALSSILNTFQIDTSWGSWSFTIYTLAFAISIPILGKFSDRIGRKKTFMMGISLFAVGSLVAAFANSFTVFLIGRAIQAIGSGGIFPITAAQIAFTYPPEKRGKALGYVGVAFGVGSILGPTLGGLIIANLDWQWIFLINVPISMVILMLMASFKIDQQTMKKPIDVLGIFILSIIILLMMFGISSGQWILLLAAILLIPILVLVEKKQTDPILNIKYFTRKKTLVIMVSSLISGFVMASSLNYLPYFTETVLEIKKGNSGMFVAPFSVASMLASLIGGMLVDKIGAKKVLIIGFLTSLIGAVSLAFFVTNAGLFFMVTVIMGFGVGIIIGAPLNVLIMQSVELHETGTAIGYLSLFRSLGSTLGPAIGGKLLATYTNGFNYMFTLSAVISLLTILLVVNFVSIPAKKS